MDMLSNIVFMVLNGLVWGSIVSLIALGMSLIFGLTEVVNLAHGELYMLGAVTAWVVITYLGGFWIALIISPICLGTLGLMIERIVLRPAENNFVNTIMITFGLSLILQYTVLGLFGGAPQRITEPIQYNLSFFHSGYPFYRIVAAIISCSILIVLWMFLNRTRLGLWMRSVKQNRELARSLGIPVERVYSVTFGLGSALAAVGGVLASPIVAVEFKMGLDILVLSFMAAIVGGLGNLKGTLLASIIIVEVEGILTVFTDPVYARVISLMVICLILLARPTGLLARTVR